LLDALRYFEGQYRGVAVVDTETVTDAELNEMHEAGVRGVRVNLASEKDTEKIIDDVKKNAAIAEPRGWVVQVWIPLAAMVELHEIIPTLNTTFVFDHYGHAEVGSKTNNTMNTLDPYQSKGFRELIDLVQRKLLFVKISAPYQNSKQDPLYEDMRVVAQTLINAGPDMVVYGSDWPHTASKEGNGPGGPLVPSDYRVINDAALVEITKDWAGSEAQIQRLFVDNPRRLWQWYSED
jgi:predicted TIM-barrel fold metal-dependent hydrolase